MITVPGDPKTASLYGEEYQRLFNSGGLTGWGYRKTHVDIERHPSARSARQILEIGAGAGEHLQYVQSEFERYVMVDLRSAPDNLSGPSGREISWLQADAADDIFAPDSFDRVISMCVLHHVSDVSLVLANISGWLRPGGTFSLFLPSDPGFLNRMNRRLVVNRRAKRVGVSDYPLIWSREHRNHYWSIRTQILDVFSNFTFQVRYWPFRVPAADLSLYSVWHISKPQPEQRTTF